MHTLNMAIVLAVAAGGALGSVGRYGVGVLARQYLSGGPWGTLIVNIIGSFAIGVLFAWFLLRPAPEWARLGLMTGVLGGFTTYSAFSLETLELFRSGGMLAAGGYAAMTLVFGLAACAFGLALSRLLLA